MKTIGHDGKDPLEGEYIAAGAIGDGDLESPHAHEDTVKPYYGKLPEPAELTREWVVARLMREATDYGTRTRQTGRVAALKLLGDAVNLFGTNEEQNGGKDSIREQFDAMPPEERRRRAKILFVKLGLDAECEEIIGSKLR